MNKLKEVFSENVANKDKIRENIKSSMHEEYNHIRNLRSIAAGVIITIGLGFGGYFIYATPTDYLGIDINPSIQLGSNIFKQVVEIVPVNDDATVLLADLELKNKNIETAVEEIVKSATEAGYINELSEDNAILITSYSDKISRSKKIQDDVESKINKLLEREKISAIVIKEQTSEYLKAKKGEYGISNGKILLIEKAIAKNPELKIEDLAEAPVKEIAKCIKESVQEEKQRRQENKEELKEEKKELIAEHKAAIQERKQELAEGLDDYKVATTAEEKEEILTQVNAREKNRLKEKYKDISEEKKEGLIKNLKKEIGKEKKR